MIIYYIQYILVGGFKHFLFSIPINKVFFHGSSEKSAPQFRSLERLLANWMVIGVVGRWQWTSLKSGNIQVPTKDRQPRCISQVASGKQPHNSGKLPWLIGKSMMSMAMFQFAFCKGLPGRVSRMMSRFYICSCRRHDSEWKLLLVLHVVPEFSRIPMIFRGFPT